MNFKQYIQFFNPVIIITTMIKTAILFLIMLHIGNYLNNKLPKLDKNKQKIIIWIESIFQATAIIITSFFSRTLIEIIGDLVDPLNPKLSSLTAKASSAIAGYALFSQQKNLSEKLNYLMN